MLAHANSDVRSGSSVPVNVRQLVDTHVGDRIRNRRLALGLTQTRLAERLGISFQQIQKYECGRNRIGAGRLYQIASVLNVDIAFFFQGLPRVGLARDEISDVIPTTVNIEQIEPDNTCVTRDFQVLVNAFDNLKDPALRRTIVELVERLSSQQAGSVA